MSRQKTSLKTFLRDNSGATAIEYALIGSLISIVIIGSLVAINGSMTDMYDTIQGYLVPALEGSD